MRRSGAALLIFLSLLVVSAYGLQLIGVQVLKPPAHTAPSVQLFCSDSTLVNVTDPNPLVSGFPSGNNGTVVYGCGLLNGGVTPALRVVRSGLVNASFSLPASVSIYLVQNTGSVSALSQTQCAAGILLNSSTAINLAVGSYSYCESFSDAANLVSVTVSWFQV
jgi:hypothetical protein